MIELKLGAAAESQADLQADSQTDLQADSQTIANPAVMRVAWPQHNVLEELQATDLLQLWLKRRIEQALEQRAPLASWRHQAFASAATSLFLQRRAGLDRVVFSILRLQDPELAQELYFRLQAGEADFPQLAHHSHGPERHLAGRIGPVALHQLQPLLADLLRASAPGELQPPLEGERGDVLLLRLDLRMPASQDDAMQEQLEQELFNAWLEAEQQRLLALQPSPGQQLNLELPGQTPTPAP